MIQNEITQPDTTTQQVYITRLFDAPRDLVFEAWTSAKHLEKWYAPNGCSIKILKFDLSENGMFLHTIQTPDNFTCTCKGVFLEIVRPEKIVYTLGFSDEEGNSMRSSEIDKHSDWPDETTVTVIFEDVQGKTRVHLHQSVSESLAKQTGAYPSWLQMLDRLENEVL